MLPELFQGVAQIVMRFGVIRFDLQCSPVTRLCLDEPAKITENVAQIVMYPGITGQQTGGGNGWARGCGNTRGGSGPITR